MVSLVLLLKEPRELDAELLTQVVNDTFNLRITCGKKDSTEFVVGDGPMWIAQFQGQVFHILSAAKPYSDDPDTIAAEIGELRVREALAEHQGWLSVDLIHQYDEPAAKEPYWYIGKLLAALGAVRHLGSILARTPTNKGLGWRG